MEKQWKKVGEEKFSLYTNGDIGISVTFPNLRTNKTALIEMQERKFTFQKFGLTQTKATVVDAHDQLIITIKPEKWYSNDYLVEMGNRAYRIKIKNAPLVHYTLYEGETSLLAYGIDTYDKRAVLKISTFQADVSPILDALLFILFYPILLENVNDDLMLLLLLSA